jgi:M6 family metalloprotease-like protein
MRKRIIYLIFQLLLSALGANAQMIFPGNFEDYHSTLIDSQAPKKVSSSITSLYSPNGKIFTPKGDLKVLIICAGLGEPYDSYPMDGWNVGTNTFPDWVVSNSKFYSDNSQFSATATSNDKNNISRFYYEMSKGAFRITADVYPTRVNVNSTGVTSWSDLNRKVIEKMKSDNPNFDWSKYDKRTNNPNFTQDNSNSTPDKMPDFIVIVYRYTSSGGSWTTNPPGVSSSGGYAAIDGLSGLNYNGYTFDANAGYTHSLGTASMYGLFIHEISHSIFDCPHYANANNTLGKYFYNVIGAWGFMNVSSQPSPFGCANGWERWYLGWIELNSNGVNSNVTDLTSLPASNEFTLRDFITTGDVVRVKIPNGTGPNQYLWLENHNGNSIFEDRPWGSGNGCINNALPASGRGLTAYIESIDGDRNKPFSFWGDTYTANGIKPFHPKGNYDYSFATQSTLPSCLLWGNKIYNIIEGQSNPLAGQNRIEGIRLDYNNDGAIPTDENANGTNAAAREYNWVAMRDGNVTYDFLGSDITFTIGQKLGMGTNPALINRPMYDQISKQMSPYYLNGISVLVESQDANGNVKVKVLYNDVTINSNLRWTGNIMLPDITTNSDPDLILATNYTLTINKSGTPNRHTKNSFNDLVNPTIFTCAPNSFLKMQNSSNIIVDNLSTFTIGTGSTLEINDGAIFTVENGSTLQVKSGATLNVIGTGKIVVKSGGYICVESGASINLKDYRSLIVLEEGAVLGANPLLFSSPTCSNSISKTGNGSIIDYTQDVYIQNTLINVNKLFGGKYIYVGNHVTTNKTTGDVLINNGASVIFDCKNITFDAGFECVSGGIYEVKNH